MSLHVARNIDGFVPSRDGVFSTCPFIPLEKHQRYSIQFGFSIDLPAKSFGWTPIKYFEVEILHLDDDATIGIGLAEKNEVYGMVGWINSVGYHSDDGNLFNDTGRGIEKLETFKEGDRVGVLHVVPEVYFVKNGSIIDCMTHFSDKYAVPTVTCNRSSASFKISELSKWDLFSIIYGDRTILSQRKNQW